jgi:hypothetical protein
MSTYKSHIYVVHVYFYRETLLCLPVGTNLVMTVAAHGGASTVQREEQRCAMQL